jgi:hypothetical protein
VAPREARERRGNAARRCRRQVRARQRVRRHLGRAFRGGRIGRDARGGRGDRGGREATREGEPGAKPARGTRISRAEADRGEPRAAARSRVEREARGNIAKLPRISIPRFPRRLSICRLACITSRRNFGLFARQTPVSDSDEPFLGELKGNAAARGLIDRAVPTIWEARASA